jgi:hypothetical protein
MKVRIATKKELSILTTVYPIFSSTVHSLLFKNIIFLIIFFNFCFHFSLTLRSPPTHCTTTKKKHPPHQSSTSILHHSTTGSTLFNHRTHDVDPPMARATESPIKTDPPTTRATEPPISTNQDRSTKISTHNIFNARDQTSLKDLAGPVGIHLQLHWRRPIHRTSPIVDLWKSGLILLLPLLDEGRRVTERDDEESERERGREKILIKKV